MIRVFETVRLDSTGGNVVESSGVHVSEDVSIFVKDLHYRLRLNGLKVCLRDLKICRFVYYGERYETLEPVELPTRIFEESWSEW